MIAFFPEPYDGELLYSIIARYHQRSGYANQISTFEDIYRKKSVFPNFLFVNAYTDDALSWMTKNISLEDLIMEHTMYPFFAHFASLEKKKNAFNALLRQEGNPDNYLGIKKAGKRYFRYCPQCANEDRAQLGETYWHRTHQIHKVEVCHRHGCYLKNTEIAITSRNSPALYDAEGIVPHNETSFPCSETETNLARYIVDVLSSPVSFTSSDVGSLLHYRLDKAYLSPRGISRNFTALYNDFCEYYAGLQVPEAWQVQKIFSGYLREPYFICQIAFWERISAEDLISSKMQFWDSDTSLFYKKLSAKYGVEMTIIAELGKEISKHIYEQNRVHAKPGRRTYDYSKMDAELLPLVQKYVKDLYSRDGRPKKLSFRKVEKALSLPPKRFNYLPRCRTYIEKHWESQTDFWAREVVWAVYELKLHGEPLNWKHIHTKTNLRFSNLQACYPHIKDNETKQIIGCIIASLAPGDN